MPAMIYLLLGTSLKTMDQHDLELGPLKLCKINLPSYKLVLVGILSQGKKADQHR